MTDPLSALLALAEKATPTDDGWLDALFADQWTPREEEYLRACSPEVVAALVRCAQVLAMDDPNDMHERDRALAAIDAALAQGKE
jgi:hypothetical protein